MIDLVNHPPHYKTESGIEAIDVIEQYGLGYHLGNAMKYLLRAGRKDPAREREDLEKARWYLKRWLGCLPDEGEKLACLVRPAPDNVAAAFRLSGKRREAVMSILETLPGSDASILRALAALEEALA